MFFCSYSAKQGQIVKRWFLVDATNVVLGRLASFAVGILRGKNKVTYNPHLDDGDYLVVTNMKKVALTGNKLNKKIYYKHTGYMGGLKENTAGDIILGGSPQKLLLLAVKRMLPRGPLARRQLRNLKMYAGAEHPHVAQKLVVIDFKDMNSKNYRRV